MLEKTKKAGKSALKQRSRYSGQTNIAIKCQHFCPGHDGGLGQVVTVDRLADNVHLQWAVLRLSS